MIVVIADDFTGAAELGGIGLRYNMKVEVNTHVNLQSEADLLVIATDTRSMGRQDAEQEMQAVTKAIASLDPKPLIFKKIDSVLRGYVTEELLVHTRELGHDRVLLVPANPALSRTITNGHYHYQDTPLHLTHFAHDPEFPVTTSSVVERLHQKGLTIHSHKHHEALPAEGIVVGDVETAADLNAWADKAHPDMLLAGASGFFTALLDKLIAKDEAVKQPPPAFKLPMLIVSGTAFAKSADAIKTLKEQGGPVSYMPAEIVHSNEVDSKLYQRWVAEISKIFAIFDKTIIAINSSDTNGSADEAKTLREKTAAITSLVLGHTDVNELLIEGGSTASAVLKQLGISRLFPVEELAGGVVRMSTGDDSGLHITVKPGSYDWPGQIQPYSLY